MANTFGKLPLSKYVLIGKYRRSKTSIRPVLLQGQYRTLASDLAKRFPGVEMTIDENGHPRTLSRFTKGGFAQAAYFGKQDASESESRLNNVLRKLAAKFVRHTFVRELLDMGDSRLRFHSLSRLPKRLGYKVVFQQEVQALKVTGSEMHVQGFVPCDQSYCEIHIRRSRKNKHVFEIVRLVSTLVHENAIASVDFQVSLTQAKAIALQTAINRLKIADNEKSIAIFSLKAKANVYKGKLQPVFKIELGPKNVDHLLKQTGKGQPTAVELIICGRTGRVVFARRLEQGAFKEIPGLALANVANRWQNVDEQFKEIKLDGSILVKAKDGRLILANKVLSTVYPEVDASEKMTWFDVSTKPEGTADGGTFKWKANEPQSSGVCAYHSYMRLNKIATEEGLTIPLGKGLKVYVDHRWNRNNATFYPQYMLIQLGWGDGYYMLPHIVYDLVVCDHEYVHAIVHYLRQIEGYIPGPLGAALNEAIADFVATLMRLLKWLEYGRELGDEITLEKILADKCVIGSYCIGGDGFRSINNNLVYPQDLKGDNKVHDNSRIVSAAMLHTFHAWLKQETQNTIAGHRRSKKTKAILQSALAKALPQVVRKLVRLIIAAIPMLPANRVTFSDWRKALEDADAMIFAGAHHQFIASGFEPHGITSNSLVLAEYIARTTRVVA